MRDRVFYEVMGQLFIESIGCDQGAESTQHYCTKMEKNQINGREVGRNRGQRGEGEGGREGGIPYLFK